MSTLYEYFMMFVLYAFIGWCVEVMYAAFVHRSFVNRGFLNGPWCPIYGFGVLLVLTLTKPFTDSILLLFAASFLITTVLEFITGFILERIFHQKWWDYTGYPLNIMGYVCPLYSAVWGAACTFVVKLAHPFLFGAVMLIPRTPGLIIAWILAAVLLCDFIITDVSAAKFRRVLRLAEDIDAELAKLSDLIGENLAEFTLTAIEKGEDMREHLDSLKERRPDLTAELESARERFSAFISRARRTDPDRHRFFKAFPNLHRLRGVDIRERLKKLRK